MTYREPLVVGHLNDGIETPGSDIKRLSLTCMAMGLMEVGDKTLGDRRISDLLPGWWSTQGEPGTSNADVGWACDQELIDSGMLVVESFFWDRVQTWRPAGKGRDVLTLRLTYLGGRFSWTVGHRPTPTAATPVQIAEWDMNLASVAKTERLAWGPWMADLDANQGSPHGLADACRSTWSASSDTIIDGFLGPANGMPIQGVAALSRRGEHHPIVGIVRVPTP